ncbi:hypothetical protein SFR_4488 [Streptomyces sp. FR-008]|nr:hypothetical protein SFR_4488 [Streptomyces sp. FR-008]
MGRRPFREVVNSPAQHRRPLDRRDPYPGAGRGL